MTSSPMGEMGMNKANIANILSLRWRHPQVISLMVVHEPIMPIMLSIVIIEPIISGMYIMLCIMIFISIIITCISDTRYIFGNAPQEPSTLAGTNMTEELEEKGPGEQFLMDFISVAIHIISSLFQRGNQGIFRILIVE